MVWRNAWLQELEKSESPQTRALMRIALTPQDHIVYPQREQVLPGVPVTVFDGLGHLELCRNRAVIAWVLQQLDDPVVVSLHLLGRDRADEGDGLGDAVLDLRPGGLRVGHAGRSHPG